MRRRKTLYIIGGLLVLCIAIGILAPKSNTPKSGPTEPAQRAAPIVVATDTPAPSRTSRATRIPSLTATAIPTKTPTQLPPTKAPPTAVPAPAASCPGGCTEHVAGCDIKGNVNSEGVKFYHKPGMSAYNNTKVQIDEGDRWFCTEAEAQAAGFQRAGQ